MAPGPVALLEAYKQAKSAIIKEMAWRKPGLIPAARCYSREARWLRKFKAWEYAASC